MLAEHHPWIREDCNQFRSGDVLSKVASRKGPILQGPSPHTRARVNRTNNKWASRPAYRTFRRSIYHRCAWLRYPRPLNHPNHARYITTLWRMHGMHVQVMYHVTGMQTSARYIQRAYERNRFAPSPRRIIACVPTRARPLRPDQPAIGLGHSATSTTLPKRM